MGQKEIRQECKSFMGKQNNYEIYISDYYLKEDMETSRFLLEYGKYRKTNKDIAAYAVRYSNDGISYYEKADGQQRYRYILPSIVKNDPENETLEKFLLSAFKRHLLKLSTIQFLPHDHPSYIV